MQNLRERFERSAIENASKTAIRHKKDGGWEDVSYGELDKRVKLAAFFLHGEDVTRGDRVAIFMKNRPEWPEYFFAIVSLGAIAVPLNPGSTPEEIENLLEDSNAKFIFTDSDANLHIKNPSRKVISADSVEFAASFPRDFSKALDEIKISADDIACILYTSGTTAEPKGVMLTHGNLISNCESQYKLGLITKEDCVVSVLPLHHAYPLTATMIFPIIYGGGIVYPESMKPEDIMEAMSKTGATVFIAVPQMYASFYQKITEALKKIPFPINLFLAFCVKLFSKLREKTGINLMRYFLYSVHKRFGKSMRLFVSGGAKLDEVVAKGLTKLGFTILEGYGLTETSPVLTMTPIKKPKIGSAGKAIPDVEIKIDSKDEKGIGEVLARGPNIMKGYYKRQDLTDDVIKDGWFYTGDLGYLDGEGYLFLTGRRKDVIVLSSGMNVYPEEVEEAYMAHAPIREMCVFEIPFKRGEEEILALWAIVVPDLEFFKKYGEINLRDVIKERLDNVSRALPSHMRLMNFSITLEELPKTLLGKIKRYEVKEIWTPKVMEEGHPIGEKELSEEDLRMMETSLGIRIIEYLKKQTGIKETIAPACLLELDLGIDSLGRIELLSGLEKVFGIEIKEDIIGEAFTVRDLIAGLRPFTLGEIKAEEAEPAPTSWKKSLELLPKEENLKRIDLKPGAIVWLACFLFLLPIWLFFKVFYSLKTEGKENFPKEGPYILYGNHTSYFDGFLAAFACPRFPRLDLFFVGFRPYFNVPIIRNLVKIGRIIPLDFSTHLLEALKSCYYVLKNGRNLCLFPEGLRTLDGNIGRLKKGFGILAKESGAKVVPFILEGAYEAWPRTSKHPKRHPLKVKLGKALDVKDLEKRGHELGARDDYDAICMAAREALIKLKTADI